MIFPRLLFIAQMILISTLVADGSAIPPPTPTSYLGGWCNCTYNPPRSPEAVDVLTNCLAVDLQLFQECHFTPNESYHARTLGNIFAINDYRNSPIATYPEGAGRIDVPHNTSLPNMPGMSFGLLMNYATNNVTYFRFGNSTWNDTVVEKVNSTGWAHPEPWTKPDMQCGDANAGYYRVSEMRCLWAGWAD